MTSSIVLDRLRCAITVLVLTTLPACQGCDPTEPEPIRWTSRGLVGYGIHVLARGTGLDVYAGTDKGGVFHTADDGAHWNDISLAPGSGAVLAIGYHENALYAATDEKMFRSPGQPLSGPPGQQWSEVSVPLTRVRGIASMNGWIYAGGHEGVWKSDDGVLWQPSTTLVTDVEDLMFEPLAQRLIASGAWGIFLSADGSNWTSVSSSTPSLGVAVDLHLFSTGHMYATIGQDLYQASYFSPWNNIAWSKACCGDIDPWLVPFTEVVERSGQVYAGTLGRGVFVAHASADDWEDLQGGLTNLNVLSLVTTSQNRVLAGTENGVFKAEF